MRRGGKPVAILIGLDEEQQELGRSARFCELIRERRRQPTVTRADTAPPAPPSAREATAAQSTGVQRELRAEPHIPTLYRPDAEWMVLTQPWPDMPPRSMPCSRSRIIQPNSGSTGSTC